MTIKACCIDQNINICSLILGIKCSFNRCHVFSWYTEDYCRYYTILCSLFHNGNSYYRLINPITCFNFSTKKKIIPYILNICHYNHE